MDKPRDNITKFRRDYRLTVVGIIRSLALLIMLFTAVFSVWRYQDELNLDNIMRLASYARAAAKEDTDFSRYDFEPGLDTVYAPFELGLAVVSSDTYRFVSGYSSAGFSAQLKYASPAICTSNRQALIYDRGNTGYSIVTGYSVIKSAHSASPILSAAMNENGDYALVTNENGYRSGVYVYSYKNREICVWQTPDYYVRVVSLSPQAKTFAALCMSESGGAIKTQVRVYAPGEQQPVFTLSFGEKMIYSIKHYKNGDLFVICEDGLYIYSEDGELKNESLFPLGLTTLAHHDGGLPMVAMRMNTGSGERTLVRAFDEDGNVAYEYHALGELRSMDYRNGSGVLLLHNRLVGFELIGGEVQEWEMEADSARKVLVDYSGKCVLIYSDRAERVMRKD